MLRWRLFGIQFTIEPSFWFMNALWALLMGGALTGHVLQDRALFIFVLVWILCTLVSVIAHELGHVITGRIFGQPGTITLSGLGGQTVGSYDRLRAWQRILVFLAGPAAGFAFLLLVIKLDSHAWDRFMDYLITVTNSMRFEDFKLRSAWIDQLGLVPRRLDNLPYVITINILTFLNLFVNIMNLFPIIPMDGGMVMKEVFCLVLPRQGLKLAFGLSFLLAMGAAFFYLDLTLERYGVLARRIEHFYPFGFPEFSLILFLSLAYQSWKVYGQLAVRDRHLAYMQDDDEDGSGPSNLPPGVREVPVKDPRDFAPPAPGSERPRY